MTDDPVDWSDDDRTIDAANAAALRRLSPRGALIAGEIQPGDVIGTRVVIAVHNDADTVAITTRPIPTVAGVWAHLAGKTIAHWLPAGRLASPCGVGVAIVDDERWRTAGHRAPRCRRCLAYAGSR